MTNRKTEKVEGATMNCFQCKTKLTCVKVAGTNGYADRLVWYDEDGAHYGFNSNTQEPFCKKQAPIIEKTEAVGKNVQSRGEIHLKDIALEQEELEQIAKEVETMLPRQLARLYFIEFNLKKANLEPTGPFVGMLYNQQMASLRAEAGI